MSKFDAVLIAGPTASGKSALAVAASHYMGGKVVNADSMQVYRELEILTARPGKEEAGDVEHFLFGHVPAARAYSVAGWLEDVQTVLAEHFKDGSLPVFCGGTGLYFKALTEGLSEIPAIDPAIRKKYRELALWEPDGLHGLLRDKDPESHGVLKPGDRHRIIRALEVADSTGRPIGLWQKHPSEPRIDTEVCLKILLLPERPALRKRIAERFYKMVEAGGVAEVENFLKLGLDESLPAMRAIGVPHLASYLRGETSLDEAIEAAIIASRQYAKRQSTWFRNQLGSDWQIFENAESAVETVFTQH